MDEKLIHEKTDSERPAFFWNENRKLPAENKSLPSGEKKAGEKKAVEKSTGEREVGRRDWDEGRDRRPGRKTRAGRVFVYIVELLAIAISFLGRSQIARFLTAKVGMDVLVEVTDRFGRDAGHRLSTVIAFIVAEPHIIAVVVAGIIVVLEFVFWLFHAIKGRKRHGKRRRRLENWE